MSKSELTFEQAVEKRDQLKNDLRTARKELVAFRKENDLKKDAEPKDPKIAAKLKKFNTAVTDLESKLEKAIESVKALKPATVRQTTYTYPKVKGEDGKEREMTAQEKKKFRAKARAAKKKAEKEAAAPAPAEKTTEKKSKKKEKKAAAEPEEED